MADTLANNVDERDKLIPDLDDPEFQKELQRPAHIKADMRDMERQRRVSLILNSQAFREELESIIESQLKVSRWDVSSGVFFFFIYKILAGEIVSAGYGSIKKTSRHSTKLWQGCDMSVFDREDLPGIQQISPGFQQALTDKWPLGLRTYFPW